MSYAIGKKALGDCDRCGFSYKLKDLRTLRGDVNIRTFARKFSCEVNFLFDTNAASERRSLDSVCLSITLKKNSNTNAMLHVSEIGK